MSFQPGANVYAVAFGSKPENVEVPHLDVRAPNASDILYPIGKRWIVVGTGEYILASQSSIGGVIASNWILLGTAGGALATLTGDSGTATAAAGNIDVLGTANQITTTGAADTLTLSLPAAITAPGSLTTTTTLAVGTNATVGGTLGVTGATTLAALTAVGTANINASGAGVTTIGTGGTGAVNIGNATGNTSVTGSLTISGNIILNGAATQLRMQGGAATDFIGTATLVNGTVTVANTNIAAGDRIFLSHGAINASTAIGTLHYTISAGASFTIESLDAAAAVETGDLSTISYVIIQEI